MFTILTQLSCAIIYVPLAVLILVASVFPSENVRLCDVLSSSFTEQSILLSYLTSKSPLAMTNPKVTLTTQLAYSEYGQ